MNIISFFIIIISSFSELFLQILNDRSPLPAQPERSRLGKASRFDFDPESSIEDRHSFAGHAFCVFMCDEVRHTECRGECVESVIIQELW